MIMKKKIGRTDYAEKRMAYDANRSQYPTFEDYYLELLKVFASDIK